MEYSVDIQKGTLTLDVVTKVEHTLSVVMRNKEGVEKDVTFKMVVTLGQYPAKWYDENDNLQDKDMTNKLELCYAHRTGKCK